MSTSPCGFTQHIFQPFSCGCHRPRHNLNDLQKVTAVALAAIAGVATNGIGAVPVFYLVTAMMKMRNSQMFIWQLSHPGYTRPAFYHPVFWGLNPMWIPVSTGRPAYAGNGVAAGRRSPSRSTGGRQVPGTGVSYTARPSSPPRGAGMRNGSSLSSSIASGGARGMGSGATGGRVPTGDWRR